MCLTYLGTLSCLRSRENQRVRGHWLKWIAAQGGYTVTVRFESRNALHREQHDRSLARGVRQVLIAVVCLYEVGFQIVEG